MATSIDRTSVEELFSRGNYVAVVMRDDPSVWQTYAAMGLVGLTKQALAGLDNAEDPDALFYRGVAHWIDGDERAALEDLGRVETEHARNLARLIEKPQIDCLSQLAWRRDGAQDLITGIQADPKFRVRNISFYKDDLRSEPYASIHKYYDESVPPDFYIAQMVEWHLIPPDLQELPCPIFGQSADYDAHIQAVYPWLQIFDEMVAADQVEWQHMSALTSPTPVTTFPKIFGVSESLPPIENKERPLDLLITGSVIYPYWPEKVKTLFEVLASDSLDYRIMEGYLSRDIYNSLLATSKLTISKLRRPSLMPTRVLDAVSMGCATIVQEGSVILLYIGDDDGVVTFDDTDADLTRAVQSVVSNWEDYRGKTLRGAEKIRRDFALSKVSSEYFRYLTFLAARPRKMEREKNARPLLQRRVVSSLGWRPDTPAQRGELLKANMKKCMPNAGESESVQSVINWAREFVVYLAERDKEDPEFIKRNTDIVQSVFGFYRTYMSKYPSSLVLKFNYVRTLFHWGEDCDRAEALEVIKKILSTDPSKLSVEVFDDVFSWDVFNEKFNYRDYFDAIGRSLIAGGDCEAEMKRMIFSSMCFYAAEISTNLSLYKNAVDLDPQFSFFGLAYARALLRAKSNKSLQEARRILLRLADGTAVFSDAFDLLETVQMKMGPSDAKDFEVIAKKVDRWRRRIVDIKKINKEASKAIYLSPEVLADEEYELEETGENTTLVTAICVADSSAGLEDAIRGLRNQTIAQNTELILYCDDAPQIAADPFFGGSLKRALCIPSNGRHWTSLFNEAAKNARGKYITYVSPGLELRADALQVLVWHLEKETQQAVAYCDLSIQNAAEESLQYIRKPEFSKRGLYSMDCVDPITMWPKRLHKEIGYLSEKDEDAAIYSLWLKASANCKFLHVPLFLGKYVAQKSIATPSWLSPSSIMEQTRKTHWRPGWGDRPKPEKLEPIPQGIVESAPEIEIAMLHKRGVITKEIADKSIWYMFIAKILVTTGNPLFAETVVQAVVKFNPQADTPLQFLMDLYRQKGKKEELEETLQLLNSRQSYTPVQPSQASMTIARRRSSLRSSFGG